MMLIAKDKVDILSVWDDIFIKTSDSKFNLPATLQLKLRVKLPHRPVRFTRRVLFNRDGWKCAYCGRKLSLADATVDHVLPKSHGGKTSWKNCVASCKPCNKRKADRTPEQAAMPLLVIPRNPTAYHIWDRIKEDEYHESWLFYAPVSN